MALRLWHVALGVVCGGLAAGNFLRLEDEGGLAEIVAHATVGAAWIALGAWLFIGSSTSEE